MSKNKLKKFAEMNRFRHVVQADFDEVFRTDYKLKGRWARDFFCNPNPVVLELGCGKGEYTVGLARRYPDKNFIGIDIKGARMHQGALESYRDKLKNVGFIRTRIEHINSFFDASEVDEIWLTFPDPQMNKTRKRLTSTRFLNSYAQFLKCGGSIHLKTDSNFLYCYTKAVADENRFKVICDNKNLHFSNAGDELTSIRTYYEERFMSHNIPIKYLSFKIETKPPFKEPVVDIPYDIYHNAGRSVKIFGSNVEAPGNLGDFNP
ncbi:tRNA (guanosine(46)-N7)-methyltransferase TrmB [Marinilabiliaceae bacterium ANBcel2]|nr:tRNA (guanosine(46)-N7)-methyltransferase TrmB [Marinilabiliaceae bacterium ANBcel2]